MEEIMHVLKIFVATCFVAASVMPAFADSMSKMKGGEVIAVMPDGHMGTMKMTDPKMSADMMKMSKPLGACIMIMTGADGKAYMVDTSTAAAKAECEKMAM